MARKKKSNKTHVVPPPAILEETNEEDEALEVPKAEIPREGPEISWTDSLARKLLVQDLAAGVVPREPDNSMPTSVIFTSRPEYAEYGYKNFSSRLSGLRKIVNRDMSRANKDKERFDEYRANNNIHTVTAQGYPCLLYTSPSPRDQRGSRMPSSA